MSIALHEVTGLGPTPSVRW